MLESDDTWPRSVLVDFCHEVISGFMMFFRLDFRLLVSQILLLFHTYIVPGEDPLVLHIERKDPDFFFHHFRRIFKTREFNSVFIK